jgi:hypothetical protein
LIFCEEWIAVTTTFAIVGAEDSENMACYGQRLSAISIEAKPN